MKKIQVTIAGLESKGYQAFENDGDKEFYKRIVRTLKSILDDHFYSFYSHSVSFTNGRMTISVESRNTRLMKETMESLIRIPEFMYMSCQGDCADFLFRVPRK